MGNKILNFYVMAWFISVLICVIIEGTQFGAHNTRNILNYLIPFNIITVADVIPIPTFNIHFFEGLQRLIMFDYSFYQGGYQILRWFWTACFAPGLVWGVGQFFVSVFAEFVRAF